ncbi:DNA (cytosine-5-)-methyltransferase [Marinilactibacillus sp. XAAS-LB27]|uniref:DNA (cytosine-5-)-methyltransferase n=1 Tax=Marinilactibacillus sp. XAAS-LB27 TaxID=3114538 RepID=UPI002E16D8EC|nr:DNA (cytosine-5-)-methyltransferase [Marinilactibacillus sp. XAAS-LB27]
MLNVVETFSGIGAQTKALKKANIEHRVSATVEWEIGAIYAYDIIHHGAQHIEDYRHHTKESLIKEVSKHNLSNNGKDVATYQSIVNMGISQLKAILYSIERNKNLVDINQVTSSDLEDDVDVLTYSFPCQDLSVSSNWWNNNTGIDRDSGNRSSLLWEIERILLDFKATGKSLPKFLLMENVSAIISKKHIGNFNMWRKFLEELGYFNQVYTLNSKNFGIPQGRQRTYMISVYVGSNQNKRSEIDQYFFDNNLENIMRTSENIDSISKYLRLDYSNHIYRKEAISSTPNYTPSRVKIFENNIVLATGTKANESMIARTITTKQDRNPNSGIIAYSKETELVKGSRYRNITPREAFLLMGFDEEDFNNLIKHDIQTAENRTLLSSAKLLKLAGNSIVVDVLVEIFKQIEEINDFILMANEEKKLEVSNS